MMIAWILEGNKEKKNATLAEKEKETVLSSLTPFTSVFWYLNSTQKESLRMRSEAMKLPTASSNQKPVAVTNDHIVIVPSSTWIYHHHHAFQFLSGTRLALSPPKAHHLWKLSPWSNSNKPIIFFCHTLIRLRKISSSL